MGNLLRIWALEVNKNIILIYYARQFDVVNKLHQTKDSIFLKYNLYRSDVSILFLVCILNLI